VSPEQATRSPSGARSARGQARDRQGRGKTTEALAGLEDLAEDLENWESDEACDPQPQPDGVAAARMLKYVQELATYVTNDEAFVINYGERYRNGERHPRYISGIL
jgi:hypothetical protein